MPHLSKKLLPRKTFLKISDNFLRTVKTNSVSGKHVFAEILSETEKVMLAKRLAVIALLDKGVSRYRISQALKVSSSTVDRVHKDILRGRYSFVQNLLKTKTSDGDSFLDILEKILSAGLPPIAGRGRWKSLYSTSSK